MNTLNKLLIGTMISGLLLTAVDTALAQNPDRERGKKGQHHQREIQAMPVVGQLMRGIRHLDLDDEQNENIKALMQGLKEEVRSLMEESKAGHLQLKELIKANSYDEQAVAALAEKEGKLITERLLITSRALSEVLSQLTDEQRAELDAMAEHRKQHRSERREHHRSGHG